MKSNISSIDAGTPASKTPRPPPTGCVSSHTLLSLFFYTHEKRTLLRIPNLEQDKERSLPHHHYRHHPNESGGGFASGKGPGFRSL